MIKVDDHMLRGERKKGKKQTIGKKRKKTEKVRKEKKKRNNKIHLPWENRRMKKITRKKYIIDKKN